VTGINQQKISLGPGSQTRRAKEIPKKPLGCPWKLPTVSWNNSNRWKGRGIGLQEKDHSGILRATWLEFQAHRTCQSSGSQIQLPYVPIAFGIPACSAHPCACPADSPTLDAGAGWLNSFNTRLCKKR